MGTERSDHAFLDTSSRSEVLPSIPGPWGEPPFVDEVKPLGTSGAIIHLTGGVLNAALTGRALIFLLTNAGEIRRHPRLTLGAVAAGTYSADLISGVLHWAFDTWFSEDSGPLSRMVLIVREHHLRPARVFQYRLRDEAGLLSWFAVLAALPMYEAGRRQPLTPRGYSAVVAGVVLSSEVTLMLEFHKWGHRMRRGRVIRALQFGRLLLSPETHRRHHSADHDTNYCLINGMADQTLGRLGLFRWLEAVVGTLTGATPRSDDIDWASRYGRPR